MLLQNKFGFYKGVSLPSVHSDTTNLISTKKYH
jgi:hypothetical protein